MKLIIATLVLLSVVIFLPNAEAQRKKGQCDQRGRCKYGGWCDKSTNTCRCNFQCSSSRWGRKLHCGLERGGPRFFRNVCHLLAHACEKQTDIPIIPMDFRKPKALRCKAPVKTQLCPRVEDFLGRCGGGFGFGGNREAGICLMDKASYKKRCRCPNGRTGYECQAKTLHVRSVAEKSDETIGVQPALSPSSASSANWLNIAVFAGVASLSVIGCVALFARRHANQKRKPTIEDHASPTDYEQAPVRDLRVAVCVDAENENRRVDSHGVHGGSNVGNINGTSHSRQESFLDVAHRDTPHRPRLAGVSYGVKSLGGAAAEPLRTGHEIHAFPSQNAVTINNQLSVNDAARS